MFSQSHFNLFHNFINNIETKSRNIIQNVSHSFSFVNQDNILENSNRNGVRVRQPLHEVTNDPFTLVCTFLQPNELCNVQSTCKYANHLIKEHSDFHWKQYCIKSYNIHNLCQERNFLLTFLSSRIKDLEEIHSQLISLRSQRHGVDTYHSFNNNGIIGFVSDIVWVDDERIAKTISKKRFMAMGTIITRSEKDITIFKELNKHIHIPCSFMPYSTASHSLQDTSHIDMLNQTIDAPGFIGYAVKLLRLRPEHEYLRYTVLWIIFKNLMIFETENDLIEYTSFLSNEEAEEFWAVSLDRYSHVDDTYPRIFTRNIDTNSSNGFLSYESKVNSTQSDLIKLKYSYTVLRYT
jgi:hypothetical protein